MHIRQALLVLVAISTADSAIAAVTGGAGVVQLFSPSAFSSQAVHLNFDSLLAGTLVTNQFQSMGVTFGSPGTTSSAQIDGVVVGPGQLNDFITQSPPNALLAFSPCPPPPPCPSEFCPPQVCPQPSVLPLTFSSPVQRVAMYVGNAFGQVVSLVAKDSQGATIGSVTVDGSADVETFLGLDGGTNRIASASIASVTCNGSACAPGTPPAIDDLHFEAVPLSTQQQATFQSADRAWSSVIRWCENKTTCASVATASGGHLSEAQLASFQPPSTKGLANGVLKVALRSGVIANQDGDGIPDAFDNCFGWPNASQNCCDPLTIRFACDLTPTFRAAWIAQGCDPISLGPLCVIGQPLQPPATVGTCSFVQFGDGTVFTQIDNGPVIPMRPLYADAWRRGGGAQALGCPTSDETSLGSVNTVPCLDSMDPLCLGGISFIGRLGQQLLQGGAIVSHFENRFEKAFSERGPFRAAVNTLAARSTAELALNMLPFGVVGDPIPMSDEELLEPAAPISPVRSVATMQRYVLQAPPSGTPVNPDVTPLLPRLVRAQLEWNPPPPPIPGTDPDGQLSLGKMWVATSDNGRNPFWIPGRTPDVWRSMNCSDAPSSCDWDLILAYESNLDIFTHILSAPDPVNPFADLDAGQVACLGNLTGHVSGIGSADPYAGSSWRPVDDEHPRALEGIVARNFAVHSLHDPHPNHRENCSPSYTDGCGEGCAIDVSVGACACSPLTTRPCRQCEHFNGDSKVNIIPDPIFRYMQGQNANLNPDPSGQYETEAIHTELEWLLWEPFGLDFSECPAIDNETSCVDVVGDRYRFIGRWVWDCEHFAGVCTEANRLFAEMHPPDAFLHVGMRPSDSNPYNRGAWAGRPQVTFATIHIGSGGPVIRPNRPQRGRPRFGVYEFDIYPSVRPSATARLHFARFPLGRGEGPVIGGIRCPGFRSQCGVLTSDGFILFSCPPSDWFGRSDEPLCDTFPVGTGGLNPFLVRDPSLDPVVTLVQSPARANHIRVSVDFHTTFDQFGTFAIPLSYSDRFVLWWE